MTHIPEPLYRTNTGSNGEPVVEILCRPYLLKARFNPEFKGEFYVETGRVVMDDHHEMSFVEKDDVPEEYVMALGNSLLEIFLNAAKNNADEVEYMECLDIVQRWRDGNDECDA